MLNAQQIEHTAHKLLPILDYYSGLSIREQQIVNDFQTAISINTSSYDIRAALAWMEEKEWIERRTDPLRGRFVSLTASGKHIAGRTPGEPRQ